MPDLDEVACVELLADFPQVLVPATVWDEVAKHRPSALMRAHLGDYEKFDRKLNRFAARENMSL